MFDSFLQHENDFNDWKKSGFPNVKQKTYDFIQNITKNGKKHTMWKHQLEGTLRTIYVYEVLGKKNVLLNIVTGGGKTAIIAAVIFWLKSAHCINKFIILAPNTIVRARLESDFKDGSVFKKFEFATQQNKILLNDLGLHVMKSGKSPQGMIESGIILGNIQQLYVTKGRNYNLAYMQNFIGDVAIFNDEAHNTPAQEYTNILNSLSEKCRFRLDTTATPDRADKREPDSDMIYHYDVSSALKDGIIKSVVVYQPEVKLIRMTYTNSETGNSRDITELDVEFKEAEKNLKPFNWILDPEPMKKQISIALQRHKEQKSRARGRYKPILFVVTMSIREGERARQTLQEIFGMDTLLVTEESDEKDREEALKIGKADSRYDAVVSVLMLREGWDVPEVSTILLLRKFSSPVYGQQVIGRGLRRIIRDKPEREILAVVDHPRLEHDWLWKMVAVSKIKQGIDEELLDDDMSDLPKPTIQMLVKPEKLIKISSLLISESRDIENEFKDIEDDKSEKNWRKILDDVSYDRDRYTITKTKIDMVKSKELKNKQLEILSGVSDYDYAISGEYKRDVLEDMFKKTILGVCGSLLRESEFNSTNRATLYRTMIKHVSDKVFSQKTLAEAERRDIVFAMDIMEDIKKNFTKPIVTGIMEE